MNLPLLPLEAIRPRWSEPGKHALLEQERVLVMSAEARTAGVQVGMRQGGVSAIAPNTVTLERDPEKEHLALDAIATALLQFTPEVTFADDFSIVLDVTASLRAFRGRLAICRRVRSSVLSLGFTARIGAAPTAMGAWLLARSTSTRSCRIRRRVLKLETMEKQLDRLPVSLLPAAQLHQEWLQGIGCETIGGLRKLPRAGLQRRTNKAVLESLDRAYGLAPEMYEWIKVPPTFSARIETFDRIEHAEALMFGANRLIMQMVGWLVTLQLAVSRCVFWLEHERGRAAIPPTPIDVALAEPTWHEDHLLRLLRERFAKVELGAPVIAIRLDAVNVSPMMPASDSLFPEPGGSAANFAKLLELLTARLGPENVLVPVAIDDHRPEVANAWRPATESISKQDEESELLERPFWILPKPIPLLMRNDRPFYGSPLKLIQGPERVECGWWDNAIAARDYFIGQASDSSCYWIYLERVQDGRWYLHGLYA